MRAIATVQPDKRRPALILTRPSTPPAVVGDHRTDHEHGPRISSEVPVGPRNGLDHDGVVSCDNITTVQRDAVRATIGLFFDDQEPELARAISDAFDLAVR